MTPLLSTEDSSALLSMSQAETNKTVAQMTALMSAISSGKENIDSMVSMLEKQPWYKKMLFTLTGKNKATVKEIEKCKDKVAAYTSAALAQLYENNRIEQDQIIAVGQAVNYVNSQLAATNYELLKIQEAVAGFKDSVIGTIGNLADKLNEKIQSVDNYHILLHEIDLNTYGESSSLAAIFQILSRIDKRTAEDDRKMQLLFNAMAKKEYLTDVEQPLSVYMHNIAELPDNIAGTVYYELFSLNSNMYAEMFCELMDSYTLLPKIEKKSKKADVIIRDILTEYDVESNTTFSTNELYEYFVDSKKEYLNTIQDIVVLDENISVDNDAECIDGECDDIDEHTVDYSEATPSDDCIEEPEEIEYTNNDDSNTFETLVVDSIVCIPNGKKMVYKNAVIRYAALVDCKGEICFENCVIQYEQGGSITLGNNARISMINCTISCKQYSDNSFIVCEGSSCNINLISCQFGLLSNFIKSSNGTCESFLMKDCSIVNCLWDFVNINMDKHKRGEITGCFIIHSKDLEHTTLPSGYHWGKSIISLACDVNETTFYTDSDIELENISKDNLYINTQHGIMKNCSFFNCFLGVGADNVLNCRFENCRGTLSRKNRMDYSLYNCNKQIVNCTFNNCNDIITTSDNGMVKYCQFVGCIGTIIDGGYASKIEFCEFYNIKSIDTSINIDYRDKCSTSVIQKCTFNGCEIRYGHLIRVTSCDAAKGYYALTVKDCTFKNCNTHQNDKTIIKPNYTRLGLFNRTVTETNVVKISNCSGLDKVNLEGNRCEGVEIWEHSPDGEPIGVQNPLNEEDVGISAEMNEWLMSESNM